jgi:hypothetical protein
MILKFNQKPYINTDIGIHYIRTIFLRSIDAFHGLAVFANEAAVLLMDNCSAHVSDDMIRILTEAMVSVITFAPHTNQVFQVLDLTLFGVPKRHPSYELPFDDDNARVKFIMNVYHDFRQTIIQSNIWGAFRALGLEFDFDMRSEPYGLLFDEEKLRETAVFQEP